jgi:uncharacterized alpha-E superfamily protein
MLSRVADSLYWMSRYLERAENIARFLDVNWHLTLDLAVSQQNHWSALVSVSGDLATFKQKYSDDSKNNVVRFLTIDPEYTNSIYSCLNKARENARSVRDIIPVEMWEQINVFFHFVERQAKPTSQLFDNPYNFCEEVKRRSMTISGLMHDAMDHDEVWLFFHLGRMLERADKTSRILDVKYFVLLPDAEDVGTIVDDVQWSALLKATSSFQAYRHQYGKIMPASIVEYLLLDHDFPRSVLYCLSQAQHCLHEIAGTRIGYFSNDAEKCIGQLCAELSFYSIDDIFAQGLHEFTDNLQLKMNRIDQAIYTTFFAAVEQVTSTINEE